jgi:YesN/AraC family two-component response regulator
MRFLFDNKLILEHLEKAKQGRTLQSLEESLSSMLSIFIQESNHKQNQKNDILIQTVRELIHADFSNGGLCITMVAEALHMSPNYLGRLFKSETGYSFSEYLQDVRLAEAVKLLEQTKSHIDIILHKTGFENKSYFYRVFKKKFGVTPREYILHKKIGGAESARVEIRQSKIMISYQCH